MNLAFWIVAVPAAIVIRVASRILSAPEEPAPKLLPAPTVTPLWKRKPLIIKEWP